MLSIKDNLYNQWNIFHRQGTYFTRNMKNKMKIFLPCLVVWSLVALFAHKIIISNKKPFQYIKQTKNNDSAQVKFKPKESTHSALGVFDSKRDIFCIKTKEITDSALGDFKPKEDFNCIRTIEQYRTFDGTFFIPPDHILTALPKKVIDCLYQRITTTIQYFCAKRSRHGSVKNGWNICTDGCYKPNSKTVVHVLSTVNDYENVQSIHMTYKINVQRHKPSKKTGTDEICLSKKENNIIDGQSIKLDAWSYVVTEESNGQGILIIDVENLTETIVDHVINSGMLDEIQQLSIRISYGDPKSGIKYLSALKHLRTLFEAGFRIYWSRQEWSGILRENKNRTSCVYLDMVYSVCRGLLKSTGPLKEYSIKQNSADLGHLRIPEDKEVSKLKAKERFALYVRYLTSIQIHCKEVIRLGHITDGGWNCCHDKPYRPPFPCFAYSFGINWDFSFDDAVVETYGCDVHSFDPSMNQPDFRRGDHIWFHNLGMSNTKSRKGKWNVSSLKDISKHLNHTSRRVDILKMDVETMEWESFPNIIKTGALANTRQMLIEFHGTSASLKKLRTLRNIYNEGFRIFWYHRNPAAINFRQGIFVQNTVCYEVYFVRV
ncbi:uncharacterized protein LOC127736906 [Mytilus californianus]|uniref:uncharacterized protein LOC127736906 n=1 Tax=Mytilus californianus TaxID=6549 RepID=UPI002246B4B6|nr:uncharacterized protein LOC127736906 [Mytilus californianus]